MRFVFAIAAVLLLAAPAQAATHRVAPGQSLAAAYRAAAPGDVIEVAAGDYPEQSVPAVAGRGGPAIEIRPVTGAQVRFGGLDIDASHVTVRGIRTGDVSVDGGQDAEGPITDVLVDGGVGERLWLQNVRDVTIRGGSYGGVVDDAPVKIGSAPSSVGITLDGVDFHDAVATRPDVHMECVWAGDVQRFTVRNSIFRNCAYFGLFITHLFGTEPKDVLIENNVFEVTKQPSGADAPYAMMVAGSLSVMDGFTFRNNTFGADFALLAKRSQNSVVVGNLGPIGSCEDGVTYRHNVWTRMRCAPTDKVHAQATRQFVDIAGHDWRLLPGAAAIGGGDPSDHPATDRFGVPRGDRPDAGAHQFEAGAPATSAPLSGRMDARLLSRSVCARSRRGCRRTSTTLRVRLTQPATLKVRIQRRGRTVRTRTVVAPAGTTRVKIRGKGLRRGVKHRVGVTATGPSGGRLGPKWITLRVR